MTRLSATSPQPKTRVSVALDVEKKQALERFAKSKNRSVHFVMLEMIDKALQEMELEAQYQDYIETRVMAVHDRVEQQGSRGEVSQAVFSRLRTEMKAYAKTQGK